MPPLPVFKHQDQEQCTTRLMSSLCPELLTGRINPRQSFVRMAMASTSASSSRSRVSVPKINVVHNIVIEDFIQKVQDVGCAEEDPIVVEGNFTVKIDSGEEGGVQEDMVLGWGVSFGDGGGCCGPIWILMFGICNLGKQQLPITATSHIMKNRKKVRKLYTLKKVLEPKQRRTEEEEEEKKVYAWVELFSDDELTDSYDDEMMIGGKIAEMVDKKGSLTIHLEISLLPCCLLTAGGKRPHKPAFRQALEGAEENVEKRIRTNAVNSLAADMSSLRDKVAADLTITCQGKSFPVHKMLLSARSDVFAAILAHENRETNDNKIEIDDTNPDTVEIFLSYLYGSKLPHMNIEKASNLMMMADKYNVRALTEACRVYLLNDIQACNVVQVAILGYLCKDEELKKAAISKMGHDDVGPLRRLKDWSKLEEYSALALEIADQMKK